LRYVHDRLHETGGETTQELNGIVKGLLALLADLGYRGNQEVDRNLGPIQRALEVLYARYTDSTLMMDDLAIAAGLSIAQFRRVFRQVTGEPPLAYLTRNRLEQARLLLAKGDFTVEAVAHRVGFDSPGSFYRRYRQYFGQSPRADQRPVVVDEISRTWAPPNTYAPSRT
jgi:AraC-like DNA-binding protein